MLKDRKPGQWWVEPFVGGGNVIASVPGNRIGADANPNTIEALRLIRDHVDELPRNNKQHTKEDHLAMRSDPSWPYRAWLGFVASFGTKWLDSYAKDKKCRDFIKIAYNSAVKQSPGLQGVRLVVSSYNDLEIPSNSIIYCDPPYRNTTKYKLEIDHDEFWEWCRKKSKEGHHVFVSEYNAPSDFYCIWEKEIKNHIGNVRKKATERLFVFGSKPEYTHVQMKLFESDDL